MFELNGFLICDIPADEQLDMRLIDRIVEHTKNTWEHERPPEEKRRNTIQGKKAELVVEHILQIYSNYAYISYDTFRADGFEKHAPFDGIMFIKNTPQHILYEAIGYISRDVMDCSGEDGNITIETRKWLETHGFFTVEIKSSQLKEPRDYRGMTNIAKIYRRHNDYACLCSHIRDFYDYFVYPHYCRDNLQIQDFYSYTEFVRDKHLLEDQDQASVFLSNLMRCEYENASLVYTRVFFDNISGEIIVPGYILKNRFFEEPRIQKMPSEKSQNAIYYMYHMKNGKSFTQISLDEELFSYDRENAIRNLLGNKNAFCPNCGKPLTIVETKRNRKFLCTCETCSTIERKTWFTMNIVHPKNMSER